MVVPGIEADEDDVVVVILPTPGFSPRSSEDVTHGHGYARVAAPDGGSTRARRYISPGGYARYHARAVASVSSRIRSDASSRESSDARFPECATGALTGASAAFSISFSRAYSRACSLSSSPYSLSSSLSHSLSSAAVHGLSFTSAWWSSAGSSIPTRNSLVLCLRIDAHPT